MAHPIFWPTKSFYYPIGNTSPVCLTGYLPAEEDARALLLGCGDLRNIFYTVHNDGNLDGASRKFDFTCCDFEPAILARNILLVTLIYDQNDLQPQKLWDLYFHFLIDNDSLDTLVSQSSKLANISKDMAAWNASEYASFVRICNRNTLAELCRLWTRYAETKTWSKSRQKSFHKDFVDTMHSTAEEHKDVATAMRSAGPLSPESFTVVREAHRKLWKSGTTWPDADRIAKATQVNPTFAFATQGEGFVAHYGTSILTVFHLAPAFAEMQSASTRKTKPSVEDTFEVCRQQFHSWCKSLSSCLHTKKNFVMRVVVGDVLSVCHTLHHMSLTNEITARHPVMAWKATLLAFDGGDYGTASNGAAPTSFNIIDTSNLSDHIGLLNIVVAAAPLLARSVNATLHTETLLSSGQDPTTSFASRLCGDISTISALLDVVPVAFVSGFSTQSNIHEVFAQATAEESKQYHERVVWKIPSLLAQLDGVQSRIAANPRDLAKLLLAVYHKMFSHENVTDIFSQVGIRAIQDRSFIHYSRLSLVLVIKYLMSRIECNWTDVVDTLISSVVNDRVLIVGMNYFQELLCQLHVHRIFSEDIFLPNNPALMKNRTTGRLCSWTDIPPVVCIVMAIPRSKFDPLEDPQHRSSNPCIMAEVFSQMSFQNVFDTVQVAFGTLSLEGQGEHMRVRIEEDPRGKQGSSVVIAFWVPSWMLANTPHTTQVGLCLKSTPLSSTFARKLGMYLRIYSAPLMDTAAVHVVRSMPDSAVSLDNLSHIAVAPPIYDKPSLSSSSTSSTKLELQFDSSKSVIESYSARQEFVGKDATRLADPGNKVETKQKGPCQLELCVGQNQAQVLHFPYPVEGDRTRLRVARKSSWIEVIVPVSRPKTGGLPSNRFPVIPTGSGTPWNIHHVNLDRMPVLDFFRPEKCGWMYSHVPFMLSDRERKVQRGSPSNCYSKTLVDVKESLSTILTGFAGVKRKKTAIYGLNRTSGGGMATVIFICDLRLDLASHTIVADGYVLPLKEELLPMIGQRLANIVEDIGQMPCTDEEITAWAYLIPAFVERCRNWAHKKDCAYLRKGAIPLSTRHSEIPICDCGKGKVSPAFMRQKAWAPFAPFVTRIAISPLFAVTYLDSIDEDAKALFNKEQSTASSAPSQQKTSNPSGHCSHCKRAFAADKRGMACSRCRRALYCDSTCQKADWKTHKLTCTQK